MVPVVQWSRADSVIHSVGRKLLLGQENSLMGLTIIVGRKLLLGQENSLMGLTII